MPPAHPIHHFRYRPRSGIASGRVSCLLLMLAAVPLGNSDAIADQSVATGKVNPEAPRASAKPARPLSYEEQEAIIRRKEEMSERAAEEEEKKANERNRARPRR